MYYNPASHEFLNNGKALFQIGTADPARLKELGFIPYFDPMADKSDHGLTQAGIVVFNDTAVQLYDHTGYINKLRAIVNTTAADDTEAAKLGVQIGEFYEASGVVRVRKT